MQLGGWDAPATLQTKQRTGGDSGDGLTLRRYALKRKGKGDKRKASLSKAYWVEK